MCAPRYRSLEAGEVPRVEKDGNSVLVIAGAFGTTPGALADISGSPTYLDMRLAPGGKLTLPVQEGDTAFAYLYSGGLVRTEPELVPAAAAKPGSAVSPQKSTGVQIASPRCVLFGREGDVIHLAAGPEGCALVFAHGRPLGESVAWRGPIVMNTQAELDLAFRELKEGNFIKHRP